MALHKEPVQQVAHTCRINLAMNILGHGAEHWLEGLFQTSNTVLSCQAVIPTNLHLKLMEKIKDPTTIPEKLCADSSLWKSHHGNANEENLSEGSHVECKLYERTRKRGTTWN